MLTALPAAAQSAYPTKPIRLIAAAPPGTPGDVLARIVAEPLAARLGQPVIVENRPGAINTIGIGAVAKAEADGHTLGVLGMPSTVAPHLLAKVPYDTLRDLAAVRQLSWVANVLVVRPSAPIASVRELIAAAKARPQHLTFASGGNGTPAHLSGELFRLSADIQMRHVPFKGAVGGVGAVMGEQVDMMFAVAPAVIPHIRAGKLRALATPAPQRLTALPDVPTLAELGYAVDVRDWHGIVAPAATPKATIAGLDAALAEVLSRPEVMERFAAAGFQPAQSDPSSFHQHIAAELQKWGRVVHEAAIKSD